MARRLRLKMVQSPAARSLAASVSAFTDAGRWPRRLGESPLRLLEEQLAIVADEFALLDGLTDQIGEFINVHVIDGGFEVPVDLFEVFDFEQADELAAVLQELLFALAAWVSGKSGGVRAGRARLLTRYNVAGASAACAPTRARLTTHCCQ